MSISFDVEVMLFTIVGTRSSCHHFGSHHLVHTILDLETPTLLLDPSPVVPRNRRPFVLRFPETSHVDYPTDGPEERDEGT